MILAGQTSQSKTPDVSETVRQLRSIAIHSLARMYRPQEQLFAFRLRKSGQSEVLEGVSRRYTATALIGLAGEDRDITAEVLGSHSPGDICGRLIADIEKSQELGELALTTWAARMLRHPHANKAVEMLRKMEPVSRVYPTVELAWALTALAIDGSKTTDMALAEKTADTLTARFRQKSRVFSHSPAKKGLSALRAHVSCFADFVYPIQALSYYHKAAGDAKAAEIARDCAERMCQLQGPEGQWWWHFDVRTGRMVEQYPVYSVHQDSMAPMALFALAETSGHDHSESIERGLRWLVNPQEKIDSLIDPKRNVIWRKVARHEPNKLVRGLQATASRVHPAIRLPALDTIFPPNVIDYETRPYHMGWILHAWPTTRDLSAIIGFCRHTPM
ncbi:MAG: hypothetical protein U9Q07_03645 [Planctomycetota bacterium]|nr:hypothetical protein [Planctomycetota bacterium]